MFVFFNLQHEPAPTSNLQASRLGAPGVCYRWPVKTAWETNRFQAMRSPSVIIGSFGRQFFLAFYGWDVFFGVSWKVKKFDEDGRSWWNELVLAAFRYKKRFWGEAFLVSKAVIWWSELRGFGHGKFLKSHHLIASQQRRRPDINPAVNTVLSRSWARLGVKAGLVMLRLGELGWDLTFSINDKTSKWLSI